MGGNGEEKDVEDRESGKEQFNRIPITDNMTAKDQ